MLKVYRILPAFEDVKEGLARLNAENYRMFAFSNGSADAVGMLLKAAAIEKYFMGGHQYR